MTETADAAVAVPSIFDIADTDAKLEEEGKWFDDVFPGANFCIRRSTSEAAVNAFDAAKRRYQKHAKNGVFPKDVRVLIAVDAIAEGMLVDWGGKAMRGQDNEPMPFSVEAAKYLLTKRPNVRQRLAAIADSMEAFQTETAGAIEGNSSAS